MRKFVVVLFVFFNLVFFQTEIFAKTFDNQVTTNPFKDWNISFNTEINEVAGNNSAIYILPSGLTEKHSVSFQFSNDKKVITVVPEKPYYMGTEYTLVITNNVKSSKGKSLKEETTMPFQIVGDYIKSAEANLNELVTNVKVQGTKDVAKVGISVNGSIEVFLNENHQIKDYQFSRGMLGLGSGDELKIRAYNKENQILEEMYYQIANKGGK